MPAGNGVHGHTPAHLPAAEVSGSSAGTPARRLPPVRRANRTPGAASASATASSVTLPLAWLRRERPCSCGRASPLEIQGFRLSTPAESRQQEAPGGKTNASPGAADWG